MTKTPAQDDRAAGSTPTCFVSYSWDNDHHKAWVRRFAEALRARRIDVRLDQLDLRLGSDLTQYMETSIRSSDYVLVVCTPNYAVRANSGKGGVGYEKGIITGELYQGAEPTKFIPVLRHGSPEEGLPSYLKNRLYLDIREDASFDGGVEAIVSHIFQRPEEERAAEEQNAVYGETGSNRSAQAQDAISFSSLMDYARRNYEGLDVTPSHLEEIVENVLRLGYSTIAQLDMAIRPVRHIARQVRCWACQQYACDQITIALALANPEYADLLGTHQAEHTEWLRKHRPRLRSNRDGWL